VPEITAIQFTPGAGTPSALAWVDMFKRIQSRGRSVLAICPPEEVIALETLRLGLRADTLKEVLLGGRDGAEV